LQRFVQLFLQLVLQQIGLQRFVQLGIRLACAAGFTLQYWVLVVTHSQFW
jgi:hypothetical protein